MRLRDLHELPKLRDGLSYLYLEHGRIEQAHLAVEFINRDGRVSIPVASLAVLLLGPGTVITHEAIKTLADNGCLVNWVGEQGVRFYAQGVGETRKGYKLIRQAQLVSDPKLRLRVVRRMYEARFQEEIAPDCTLEQIRGMEGARVRRAYTEAARRYHVLWFGRNFDRGNWGHADPINRALSSANACLNSICHAALVSAGYSPGLGFIHTGKQLSFVYDIADLYKTQLTVPLAFRLTAESPLKIESRIRFACRDLFQRTQLLGRIVDDVERLLNLSRPFRTASLGLEDEVNFYSDVELATDRDLEETAILDPFDVDRDPSVPGALWDGGDGPGVAGGVNYGGDDS